MTQGNEKDLDLVIFGATGFTGQFVVEQICQTIEQLPGLKWAIAGRSRTRLTEISTIVNNAGGNNVPKPEILVADADNPETLNALARRTKVLINCVGPFRFYGEPVVKACVENFCDYIDISGEPDFIERMQLTYDQAAKNNNTTVVSACGYDSIPAELGFLYTKQQLQLRNAIPSQIEMISSVKGGKSGIVVNYGTYSTLVHGIANVNSLRELRKNANRTNRTVPRVGPPMKRIPNGKWDNRVKAYVIPSFLTDHSVIKLSQQLDIEHRTEVPPAQIAAYLAFPRYRYLLMFYIGSTLINFLAKYSWGRSLILKYPRLFSFGFFSHDGPTLEQIQQTSFYHMFYARGISKSRIHGDEDPESSKHNIDSKTPLIDRSNEQKSTSNLQPDVEIVTKVTGPEPGYSATSIIVVQCAYTLLREKTIIPKGVLTPAVSFGKTSLFQNILERGIKFQVLEGYFSI
ncbi:putative saccharopine dehydrogenase-like protein [Gigaspora margarita]|uniref:Putative saccharopine dehydrogenase-like protein n=2 Tax=Gigaspora margarita TaxID=4874 RepID=A0A8H3WXU2_GIGMA|nr:putative saccharopine dehydrogenase-like protein [Gigaspora margarita]